MEAIEQALQKGEKNMVKAYGYTQEALAKVHAGRASPNMLDGIMVDYHGSGLPIEQMATISTPDVRVLTIQPWEKTTLPAIEKAILNVKT